ncbi:response regulator transcription factor [Sphingomonas oligophenolica]|uniref:LuxR C-terminal-related transcriptional regulator n=2 Tax=Sphingomonas oligophenolica TaxID=301154 RepID=A0ABU9Y7N3_9SPHN
MTRGPLAIPSRIYVIGDRRAFDEVVAVADPKTRLSHFADVESFLAVAPHLARGAVILAPSDEAARLADLSEIVGRKAVAFVLVALARHDVAQAVTAIRMGASDVIVRPCSLDHLHQAIARARQAVAPPSPPPGPAVLQTLTDREREVFDCIIGGMTNKQIGAELGISHRTVEIHRGRVMRKLGVARLAELLEIGFALRARMREGSPAHRVSGGPQSGSSTGAPQP